MLSPRRIRHRKVQRGVMKGRVTRGGTVKFGEYGIQALETAWITNRQIEAARIAMTRKVKRGGKIWIRMFPDKPVSKKPAETRMGKGKPGPDYWCAPVKTGKIMFEIAGVEKELALEALRIAIQKLPIRAKVVEAQEI